MVLESFDQEKYEKAMKQEGYEDGYQAGEAHGYQAGEADGLKRLIHILQGLHISREEIAAKIQESYCLSGEEAAKYLEKYWKS